MEQQPIQQPAVTPPGQTPAPQPQQTFVQPQPFIQPEPYEGGGAIKKFDYVEIGFMIFGIAIMSLVGYYYVQKAKQSKKMANNLSMMEDRIKVAENKLALHGKRLGIAA